jgi:hypothetical protein
LRRGVFLAATFIVAATRAAWRDSSVTSVVSG